MAPTPSRRTNEQWLEDLRAQGQRAADAHADLIDAMRRGLAKALRLQGVDDSTLEDYVQEGAMRVLGALDTFRGQSRFTTWAITVGVRTAFTQMRRNRWKRLTLSDLEATHDLRTFEPVAALPDEDGDPELRSRICGVMRQVIEQELPDRQRRLVLAELAEMPMDQLASEFGLTRNAAYKAGHDARKRLKAALERRGFTEKQVQEAFGLRARAGSTR